jgi:hypothetical protein
MRYIKVIRFALLLYRVASATRVIVLLLICEEKFISLNPLLSSKTSGAASGGEYTITRVKRH